MNKNAKIIVRALLCIFIAIKNNGYGIVHCYFPTVDQQLKRVSTLSLLLLLPIVILAQQPSNAEIKAITIGQPVPDLTLANLYSHTRANGESIRNTKLADFKGKLVILDFWATWCSPCVAAIPKMDSLQQQFKGAVQFIAVTHQSTAEAMPLLKRIEQQSGKSLTIPQLFADQRLRFLFPHRYLPHYVWINEKGIVIAITDANAITATAITEVLRSPNYKLPQKQDQKLDYNKDAPLFFNGNGGDGNTAIYSTMLSGFVKNLGCGLTINQPESGNDGFAKLLVRNLPIVNLFTTAIGAGKKLYVNSKICYETKDSLSMMPSRMDKDWEPYVWCYEMRLPKAMQHKGYELMLDELKKLFSNYDISLQKRLTTCYALVKIPGATPPLSTGKTFALQQDPTSLQMQNGTLDLFVNTIEVFYYFNSKVPVVNLTNYPAKIDLNLTAKMSDMQALNAELRKYGVEFVKGKFEIDMIVVKDANK